MACQKPIQTKVQKWRMEHEDWSSLAAFVLSKNTGRRLKKKTKKTKKSKQKKAGLDGKQSVKEVAEAEVLQSYKLTGKLEQVQPESNNQSVSQEPLGHDTCIQESGNSSVSSERTDDTVEDDDDVESSSDGEIGNVPSPEGGTLRETDALQDSPQDSPQDAVSEDFTSSDYANSFSEEEDSHVEDSLPIKSNARTKTESSISRTKTESSISKPTPKSQSDSAIPKVPTNKDMVIKKLNLKSLGNEEVFDGETERDLNFLFAKETAKISQTKAKDPFFINSDEEDEQEAGQEKKQDEEEEEGDVRSDAEEDVEEEDQYVGRPNLDSMFLGNLSTASSSRR